MLRNFSAQAKMSINRNQLRRNVKEKLWYLILFQISKKVFLHSESREISFIGFAQILTFWRSKFWQMSKQTDELWEENQTNFYGCCKT